MDLLMPHQQKALGELRNGNILKGTVGSGKTLTALSYYNDNDTVERLVVITTAKKRDSGDWQAEARLLGLFPEVDSWHNISKYEDVKGAFFIFDEQRIVGSGEWVKSFLRISRTNQWILLSATPGDSWLDYLPVFLANGFYTTRTEFIREHVIFAPFVTYPKVTGYRGTEKLRRMLESVLVEMTFEKHTTRHETDVYVEYDRELYDTVWRKRWNYLEKRPIRNASELFSLMRRVTNTSSSRTEKLLELSTRHPRIIIFYNFDYELEILRGLSTSIPPWIALAEWNGHKHEPIPESNEWIYLVQYAAGAEGWNCTETDTIVFYSLSYSYRMTEQAKGRIDRLDTPFTDLWYYILRSSAPIDRGIAETLSKKQNFNELKWLKGQRQLSVTGLQICLSCLRRSAYILETKAYIYSSK